MKSDIEMIESIKAAAVCSIGDELAFAFPEVLNVISQCSINEIAVLGVEINKGHGRPFQTEYLSRYSVPVPPDGLQIDDWGGFVQANNSLAENFIRQHPTGEEHFYLLAATSWKEFLLIQAMKRR
jgi:hypothetical protein